MNIKNNMLTLLLLASTAICQDQTQKSEEPEGTKTKEQTQEIQTPQEEQTQIPEATAELLNAMYKRFATEYGTLELCVLSQEQVDEIIARYDKEEFTAEASEHFKNIVAEHKNVPAIQENAKLITTLLEKTMKSEPISEEEITILQAEQFIYLSEIINEISKLYIKQLKEGKKSMLECQDIKKVLIHSLVMM